MDFEQFAVLNGCSSLDMGECALHKANSRISRKQWNRMIKGQLSRDIELAKKRETTRKEFERLKDRGEIREPTRIERLKITASGHPDNESVQAARRILGRMGIIHDG